MSKIFHGLKGVMVIKDNILVHGEGDQHDTNLYDCGIRLRKVKCILRNQVVMWFGHIFSKQRMAADPAKVEHIKTWKAPKSKRR